MLLPSLGVFIFFCVPNAIKPGCSQIFIMGLQVAFSILSQAAISLGMLLPRILHFYRLRSIKFQLQEQDSGSVQGSSAPMWPSFGWRRLLSHVKFSSICYWAPFPPERIGITGLMFLLQQPQILSCILCVKLFLFSAELELKNHVHKAETLISVPAPPQMPLPEIPQQWLVSVPLIHGQTKYFRSY